MLSTVSLASDMGIGEAGLTAIMGYAVVFLGLVLLMIVVFIMGKIIVAVRKRSEKSVATSVTEIDSTLTVTPQIQTAPGSAGQVKLFDVPDKEAAMIMAIVADKMGKPLNELRFKSIKEVKKDEI